MNANQFKFSRRKTLGIEPKNEEKVYIKIPLEIGGFWEREYFQNDLIGNVVNDFKQENHVDIPKDYFMDWNCKNKSLKMTDKIKTLLVQEIPTICLNPEMKKKPLEIQEEEIIPQVVGKPFNNPFEVFLFKKSDKILKIQTYDENIIKSVGLNDYNSSSAYCNGNNQLFISGGEKKKNNEIINKLWQIDLENNTFINDPIIIPPKKNHSMIFIPPSYVFIVGGNDKKTFYFDCEKQEISDWAELNLERNEPALQRIGNILYCFDNVNKINNAQLSFEKTELNSKNPKWTLFYPKFEPSLENEKLPQKFFGTAKDRDNNIIFLGGNMDYYNIDENTLNNYQYNPDTNTIGISTIPYKDYNFKEKTFLPYNKNIDYILPDFNKQHPEVVFYVKNKSKVEKVNYKPNKNNSNKENILRGPKRPLFDSKYDFNMPTIVIPDTYPDNLNDNLNINKNIKLKAEPPKYISPYANKEIHEPSFQEYDFNLNYKIEQPPPFKEPEIEANKGDQRLSIEIPNNIIENEKKEVDLSINVREEEKNENESKNGRIKLKYVPRPPPPPQYKRQIISKFDNELTIPKFHYSVNDPGNELIITRKGKVYTSYIPREPVRIKESHADLNIKSSRLEKDDLILPNYNYSINISGEGNYRSKSPGNLGMSARNMNFNGNLDGDAMTPNIHMPKSGNMNFNLNTPDYKYCGNIPGINTPSGNINIKGPKIPNFEMSGIIHGSNTPKANLKGPTFDGPDYSFKGKIPGTKINTPKIDVKGPNINGPDFNLSGRIPGAEINAPKIDVKGPNIDVKSPNINGPDFNLSGKIPGAEINAPKIDLKGPDYNLNGNISGVNVNAPEIDMPSGRINLKGPKIKTPDHNLKANLPEIDVNTPKIDIPKPNINLKGPKIQTPNYILTGIIPGMKKSSSNIDIKGSRKIPDFNLNANTPQINLKTSRIHMHSPDLNDFNIKGSRRLPQYDIKGSTNMSGFIPGLNVKGSNNITLPSGNINLKGPKINNPNYSLSGNIPGMNINSTRHKIKSPDFNLKGHIPGMKINSPKVDINGPKINGPDFNLKGDIPGLKLNAPKLDIKTPNVDLNKPNIDLKGPKIESPDVNIKGDIPGVKIKVPKVDIKSPNVDLKGPDYNLNGSIPGIDINVPKLDMPSGNINLKGPNIKGPKYNLSGNIPEAGINGPKIDLKAPKVNINGPKSDFELKGDIPGMKIKVPKVDIRSPNVDLKGPDYKVSGYIPGIDINAPKLDMPSGNINLKGPNIKSPNANIKGTSNYNLSGKIPGIKVNSPNINIPSGRVNLKGPKINGPNYQLTGNINGKNSKNQDYYLSGTIPSSGKINPNLEIKNYKITQPNVKFSTISPDINIKNSYNNNINASINYRGNSAGKKNFHGNLNDPNYLDYSDIKGSRRAIFKTQIDDYDIPRKIDKTKLNVSGNKIIDEQDVYLQEPFNVNTQFLLQDQNKQPNRKSVHLVVSQHQIQPEPAYNEINIPQPNIEIKAPNINIEKNNIDLEGKNIDINLNNNNKVNLGDINLKMNNNIEGDLGNLGNVDIKMNNEENKHINIQIPNLEIKNDTEINPNLPNINIEKPNLKGKVNLTKKTPTNLRFKEINDEEEDKKKTVLKNKKNDIKKDSNFGVKINVNMNDDSDSNNDSESNTQKKNFSIENNSKSKISSKGKSRKGRGLPTVGVKTSNFQTSKIDVAGRLNVDDVNVDNLKTANVGINGVKLGERIIE